MVVELVRVRRCDICGSDDDVRRYRLGRLDTEPRTITVDLCMKHSEPVEAAMAAKPIPRRTKRAVIPMSEVTARKQAARRAAKKS